MKTSLKSSIYISAILLLLSCSENNNIMEQEELKITNYEEATKDELMKEFASVLSIIVEQDDCVRSFLKNEALTEFDKNYDILWAKVREEEIGDCTLRQRFVDILSEDFVNQLECKVPRLNILFSELPQNISAQSYDVSNNDLPIALREGDNILLYSGGVCEDTLSLNEIPLFNVLVINENNKVRVSTPTRGSSMTYTFIHPYFDNRGNCHTRAAEELISANHVEEPSILYNDAIEAYKYFYTAKDGQNSYKYQRDNIYFGITPEAPEGIFDENVREYISYIKVSPKAYTVISDEESSDPFTDTTTRKKRDFNEKEKQEFLTKCWTNGSFEFIFSFIKSSIDSDKGRGSEMECIISAKPSDLWDVNMDNIHTYRSKKPSIGNHSRYTMEIVDFDKMTEKTYFISPKDVKYLGNWDIRTESMVRYLTIYELDSEEEDTYEWDTQFTFVNKQTWNVQVEGTYGGVTAKASYTNESDRTKTYSQKVTRKVHRGSDCFGKEIPIYYNDPIIKKINSDGSIEANCYNFDYFSFGLVATH